VTRLDALRMLVAIGLCGGTAFAAIRLALFLGAHSGG
jgi:hypothetical protein